MQPSQTGPSINLSSHTEIQLSNVSLLIDTPDGVFAMDNDKLLGGPFELCTT